ncbi:MAG: hypothetical protein KF802_00820 [Bdellovibrionaceae bacterium]|nr:hypothetical protein [Pseudobdellovibrionaceae bacterium]MBX3035131.1 hypothetical protein [Pseudobdellovibrionaceae bacterium]
MKPPIRTRRWAVFISGRGSNLQALLDQLIDVDIRWVLSSKASAPGLLRARRQGIAATVLPKKIDWAELDRELRRRGIEAIFLAGFMKIIPEDFVRAWAGRMLNVHPSLLPQYPGLNALEKSYDDNAPMGVTVHVVTPEMDAGPQVFQRRALPAGAKAAGVSAREAQVRISRAEQRLVREAVRKWR